jgi:hypothetical protein
MSAPKRLPLAKAGYTRAEAAAYLGVCPNTITNLVLRGLIRPSRALRRQLFAVWELNRFMADTSGTKAPPL